MRGDFIEVKQKIGGNHNESLNVGNQIFDNHKKPWRISENLKVSQQLIDSLSKLAGINGRCHSTDRYWTSLLNTEHWKLSKATFSLVHRNLFFFDSDNKWKDISKRESENKTVTEAQMRREFRFRKFLIRDTLVDCYNWLMQDAIDTC